MIDEIGARIGCSTCGGSVPLTSVSFSATIWRARKMSVPQSNSTQTTAMPTAVAERTRRTPDAPLIAASIGNVTSVSISSGAMPRPSVRTVTVGAVRSGNTSTGMLRAVHSAGDGQQHRQRQHQSSDGRSTSNQSRLIGRSPQWTWPSAGSPDAAEASCTS